MLKNVAGSITIRIKLGATTVFDSGGVTPTSLGDRYKWTFSIWFMNSTASAQKWNAWMNAIATAQAFAALLGDSVQALHMEGQASSAEDTSSARTLEVTIEWSVASASLSFRREIALLELLPKS
jgi:L-fucose isomerase-like protein